MLPNTNPRTETPWPGEDHRSPEEIHRDRMSLLIVIAIFLAMIGLVVWGALLGPPPSGDMQFPIMP